MRGTGYPRAAWRLRDRDGLGDRAEQRALRGIEHAARIELDDHAEHVVVLQQIRKLLELGDVPGEVERVGTQPGEHAEIALRRRRALLVVHRERQLATVRQRADAALDRLPGRIALQDLEPEAEADLVVRGLKLRGIADACNGHAANDDRVVDDVRENRAFAGRRENAHGEDGARRILRTREGEEVGDVGRGLADRPRTVNVIGHRQPPFIRSSSRASSTR